MAEYTKNVFESVSLHEAIKEYQYIVSASDTLSLVESLTLTYKVVRVDEQLTLYEKAKLAGGTINNEAVSEVLALSEVVNPRVFIYNAGDTILLNEYIAGPPTAIFERLIIEELALANASSMVSDALVLIESIPFNISKNMIIPDFLAINEGLAGFIVRGGIPIPIAPPYVVPGSPYVTGIFVQETPTGVIDGVNPTFIISYVPLVGTLQIYVNGIIQTDYTVSVQTITFLAASIPQTGDSVTAYYVR